MTRVTGEELLLWLAAAFAVTLVLTRSLIAPLRSHGFGKKIRADGPDHEAKAGTPTMGGLGMLAALGMVSAGLVARHGVGHLVPMVAAAGAFALLGLLDDLSGLGRLGRSAERGVGLTARRMFALQAVVAAAVAAIAFPAGLESPLLRTVVFVLVIVGTANGANMADGLDGLAAGLLALAFGFMAAVIALAAGGPTESVALAGAASVACLAFLVFNRHPAKVMMGNVASYALGALLGGLALSTNTWIYLPVVGAVLAAEVVSVVVQVGYFKATGGRRVFRMAPLHHHFELGGKSEQEVVRGFWLAGMVAGVAGLALAAF